MESLGMFMRDIYIPEADKRLTIKEIYEDFRKWIINKHGLKRWNEISKKQFYTEMKGLSEYSYVRYKEGYCLKGIKRKEGESQQKTVNINVVSKIVCPRIKNVTIPTIGTRIRE